MSKVKTTRGTIIVPFDLSCGHDTGFCHRVEEAVDQGPRSLYLDCSRLDPVHSSHIGLLWRARGICRQKSIEVFLENTSNSLIRTLQVLDLTDIFEINVVSDRQPDLPASRPFPTLVNEQHVGDFCPDVAGVDQGVLEFMDLLEQWRLDEEIRFDLRTLFYEVATNIRCHSGLPVDARVQYRLTCAEGELQLIIEDDGKPFNPLSLSDDYDPETAAQNRQTRGFGISLIRRLADDIQYTHRDSTTNVLSLTKRYGVG